ncbi:chromosome segregation ATPase [Synechococcus sp. KORDI-100]|nr:chromosome segregation ATPase [Synechococcus sp. KORDI-100]
MAAAIGLAVGSMASEGWRSKFMALTGTGFASCSAVALLVANGKLNKRYGGIISVEDEIKKVRTAEEKTLTELTRRIESLRREIAASEQTANTNNEEAAKATEKTERLKSEIAALQEELENEEAMSAAGFGPRRYPDLNSTEMEMKLKANREKQKNIAAGILLRCMRSDDLTIEDELIFDGSIAKYRNSLKRRATAYLRGFNGECDAAISTLKHNNDSTVINKINRAFDFYDKKAGMERIPWNDKLLVLREKEAYLVHEIHLQKQIEREEQAELRQQIRDEERAIREIEKATNDAEREAAQYAKALKEAQKIVELAGQEASEKQRRKIAELERLLEEANENKERAMSRAQMTKSGHVYIISNIGSFGDHVYKVGMTRRLEPMDRVRELGDASVPFPFDVHAMIFTDDAPGLEHAIHKQIEEYRLNRVNLRREFFTISIDELKAAVDKASENSNIRYSIHWTRFAEAEQYRQSLAERELVAA